MVPSRVLFDGMEELSAVDADREPKVEQRDRLDRLEQAYVRNAAPALRFAYFLTGDREAAQDLLQEAFVRVATRLRHLHAIDDVDVYLRRTMVNLYTSSLRRRRLERRWLARQRGLAVVHAPAHDPTERDEVWRALQALPDRQRAAVVLRFYEDLSEHETASALGCTRRALNSLIARALPALRVGMSGGEDR
jgi:RNA polymerase sigma-70 factor (sigma-E family)